MKSVQKIGVLIVGIVSIAVLLSYLFFFSKQKESTTPFSRADAISLEWDTLQLLDPVAGDIPPQLRKINGSSVKIPGFIIPLEDNQDNVSEFLFVPSPMSCIHVPPPPPNQVIHVRMASGKKAKMSFGPVWLFGKFIINESSSGLYKSSYECVGSATEPYR